MFDYSVESLRSVKRTEDNFFFLKKMSSLNEYYFTQVIPFLIDIKNTWKFSPARRAATGGIVVRRSRCLSLNVKTSVFESPPSLVL